jgi:glycosyltransferase involved in cell wall biosynthesis
MITYNHEKYVSQAIDGVLMQKTSFPIELIIGEDCSSDNTREICTQYELMYPYVIKLRLQETNVGMSQNFIATLLACTGEYIALCEGDDYWTDPYKLQKQVDFLKANPDYGMISGGIKLIDRHNKNIPTNKMLLVQKKSGIITPTFFDLLQDNLINTLTVCIRSEIIKELAADTIRNKKWYVIDYWFWLNVAINHKIYICNEIVASYRIHSGGISQKKGFLKQIIPWIRFDAIKRFVSQGKNINQLQKAQIGKVIIGLIFNRGVYLPLKSTAISWLIFHPAYLWSFLKLRSSKS